MDIVLKDAVIECPYCKYIMLVPHKNCPSCHKRLDGMTDKRVKNIIKIAKKLGKQETIQNNLKQIKDKI